MRDPGDAAQVREAAHRFFARAANALEEAFAPYLPTALPAALEAMAHVGNAEVVGPYKRAVHTGALEEQVCPCVCHSESCGTRAQDDRKTRWCQQF